MLEPARETEKAAVVAVASRDTGRAQSYAHEHDIERAYGSYEELLEDPDVEAIYNSLPNSMHVDRSIRALEAGKHVLVEKPMARQPEDVERAYDVTDRNGRLLMEAFMYRHQPQTHKLKDLVRSGAIGELRHVQAALENLSAAIRGEAEPLLGRSDAVSQARTIRALYDSAETGAARDTHSP